MHHQPQVGAQLWCADLALKQGLALWLVGACVLTCAPLACARCRWLAPEVLAGGQGGLSADVWAFGTVMWELLTWQLPFSGMNPYQVRHLTAWPRPSPPAWFPARNPAVPLHTSLWHCFSCALPAVPPLSIMQIINAVQAQENGAALPVPPPEQLPAGTFSQLDKYVEIMQQCWQRDPAQRPTMDIVATMVRALRL